jgi:hypothetical protein
LKARELIYQTIETINLDLPPKQKIAKKPEANLGGTKGPLDSLALVRFVVLLEQNIEKEGKFVNLTEAAFSENSPFKTVKTLEDHLNQVLEQK